MIWWLRYPTIGVVRFNSADPPGFSPLPGRYPSGEVGCGARVHKDSHHWQRPRATRLSPVSEPSPDTLGHSAVGVRRFAAPGRASGLRRRVETALPKRQTVAMVTQLISASPDRFRYRV